MRNILICLLIGYIFKFMVWTFGVFLVNCSWFIMLQEVEKDVKARTKGETGAAKTLCSPFDQPELPEGISIVQVEVLTCYYFILPPSLYN